MEHTGTLSSPPSPLSANMRRLRGLLAEERISHTRFAEACGINRAYFCRVLSGSQEPGELVTIKIARGIAALGLDQEVAHAAN